MHTRQSLATLTQPRRGGVLLLVVAAFALGLLLGARSAQVTAAHSSEPAAAPSLPAETFDVRTGYPAQVLRVLDGDTFEARMRVWPGLDMTTRVRLRGIDAPELRARCAEERVRAEAARAALEALLAEGGVAIRGVTLDKYGGRVDAEASTRRTPDVSAALMRDGHARGYDGGRRASWC
jgi:endonuclease YncB( thermonuclease family)